MLGVKYDLLNDRLKSAADFTPNNNVWKTGAMNKWIADHQVQLENGRITVQGKYRKSKKRVQLLRDSDLDTVWHENHNQPGMHADREKTIHKICMK